MSENAGKGGAVPRTIREGLFLGGLSQPESLKLAGTRCSSCGETSLGSVALCPNCGSAQVEVLKLGDQGTLWTFTVARHRPPGDYRGPEPFKPFGIGLVELAEGLRVMSTLDCPLEQLRVGMPLWFTPYLRYDKDGGAVVAFTYRSIEESAS
ncbi:MAG: OB-fold domain-containing protein [Steroidobacteraceae bacterium]|jgi:uncharacterized OB-fold protein